MITVCKRFSFDYAHYLPSHKGKCAKLHGHTGLLEVEIGGLVDSHMGMIEDFGDLKDVVEMKLLDLLDHTCLNDMMSNPTAENIVLLCRDILEGRYGERLVRIRVYETPDSYAEWKA